MNTGTFKVNTCVSSAEAKGREGMLQVYMQILHTISVTTEGAKEQGGTGRWGLRIPMGKPSANVNNAQAGGLHEEAGCMLLGSTVSLAASCLIPGPSALRSYVFIWSHSPPPPLFPRDFLMSYKAFAQPFLVICEMVQQQSAALTVWGYFTWSKSSSGCVTSQAVSKSLCRGWSKLPR